MKPPVSGGITCHQKPGTLLFIVRGQALQSFGFWFSYKSSHTWWILLCDIQNSWMEIQLVAMMSPLVRHFYLLWWLWCATNGVSKQLQCHFYLLSWRFPLQQQHFCIFIPGNDICTCGDDVSSPSDRYFRTNANTDCISTWLTVAEVWLFRGHLADPITFPSQYVLATFIPFINISFPIIQISFPDTDHILIPCENGCLTLSYSVCVCVWIRIRNIIIILWKSGRLSWL